MSGKSMHIKPVSKRDKTTGRKRERESEREDEVYWGWHCPRNLWITSHCVNYSLSMYVCVCFSVCVCALKQKKSRALPLSVVQGPRLDLVHWDCEPNRMTQKGRTTQLSGCQNIKAMTRLTSAPAQPVSVFLSHFLRRHANRGQTGICLTASIRCLLFCLLI